jgi:hypothetical protein
MATDKTDYYQGILRFGTTKGTNYVIWESMVEDHLRSKDAYDDCIGKDKVDEPARNATAVIKKAWYKNQSVCKSEIRKLVAGDALAATFKNGISTADDMWSSIKEFHYGKAGGSKQRSLYSDLSNFKQGSSESCTAYAARFFTLSLDIKTAGIQMEECLLAVNVIDGMNNRLTSAKMTLKSQGDLELDTVLERIRDLDGITDVIEEEVAFRANDSGYDNGSGYDSGRGYSGNSGRGRGHQGRGRGQSHGGRNRGHQGRGRGQSGRGRGQQGRGEGSGGYNKCNFCGEDGHWARECELYQAARTQVRTNVANRVVVENTNDNFLNQDVDAYLSCTPSIHSCYYSAPHQNKMPVTNKKDKRLTGDSAATSHMSYDVNDFKHITPLTNHWVRIGDNTLLPAIGKGEMIIISKRGKRIVLTNALYVPDLGCKLVSIGKLHESGKSILMPANDQTVMMIKNKRGECLMTARKDGGLYIMEAKPLIESIAESRIVSGSNQLIHQRMGHAGESKMKALIKSGQVKILKIDGVDNKLGICSACKLGKMRRKNKKSYRRNKERRVLGTVHTDIAGPFPEGKGKFKYFITFRDEKSRHGRVYFMKSRNEALDKLKIYRVWAEKSRDGCEKMKRLMTDGAGEYESAIFRKYLADNGIEHLITNADDPAQNGIAEGYGKQLQQMGMTKLKHAKLEIKYWPYAVNSACYVTNRLPMSHLLGKSPHEVWYRRKADLDMLRTFGTDAWVKKHDNAMRKGGDKARKGLFLGYRDGLKGYLFEMYDTKRMVKSQNAAFYEGDWIRDGIKRISDDQTLGNLFMNFRTDNPNQPPSDYTREEIDDDDEDCLDSDDDGSDYVSDDESVVNHDDNLQDVEINNLDENNNDNMDHNDNDASDEDNGESDTDSDGSEQSVVLPDVRPRRHGVNYDLDYSDQFARFTAQETDVDMNVAIDFACIVGEHEIVLPLTYEEAMNGSDKDKWKPAIDEEVESLLFNQTWDEKAIDLPNGRKCVGTKWIFTTKKDEQGKVVRYKARLVAKGFTQRKGQDYDKTFAPVMQTTLLRTLLATGAEKNWEIDHVDIKSAYLNSELDAEIYINLPEGIACQGSRVRRLRKALYGLKQAGRQWHWKYHKTLEKFGLKRCDTDPCCYWKMTKNGPIIVITHVDDSVIFSESKCEMIKLKKALTDEYKIKDFGPLKWCIGWNINRDRKKKTLTIGQEAFVLEILSRFGLENIRTRPTAADPNVNLTKQMCPSEREERLNQPYLELLGCLLYLSISTRPDISFAVSELSKFANNPGLDHWNGLLYVVGYIKRTAKHVISYGHDCEDNRLFPASEVHGFVDANYGRCIDTGRSRYGGVLLKNGGAIDWRSKMESIVALSSMESEYIGACEFVRHSTWLRACLKELGIGDDSVIDLGLKIGIDNKSAKMFAEERMIQNRSKHIAIRFHYIRERIADGTVKLFYRQTQLMPADIFTKPLGKKLFDRFRKMMGIIGRD